MHASTDAERYICLTHSLQDPQRTLDLHNQARAARGTGALSWSPSLASSAQAYANRCVFQVSWDGSRLLAARVPCAVG